MAGDLQYIYYSNEIKEEMRNFYRSLNEKDRRRYAALEALKLEYGGQKYISEILGCDSHTIKNGIDELNEGTKVPDGYSRIPNAGAKKKIDTIENIDEIFLKILKENTAGSPMNEEIKWTNLRLKEISEKFSVLGYEVSEHVIKQLLQKHKYVKRKMQKDKTFKSVKNRDEQFKKIEVLKNEFFISNNPIISVDVKKKKR